VDLFEANSPCSKVQGLTADLGWRKDRRNQGRMGLNDYFFTQAWLAGADGQSVGHAPVAVVPVLTGL